MTNQNLVNKIITFLLVFFVGFGTPLLAQQDSTRNETDFQKEQEAAQKEGFELGKLIIEHITDSYEYHIFSVGSHHLTVPLPVILYDQGHWITFWSSEFHHRNGIYKGYYVAEKGNNQGKIVRKDAEGNVVKPQLDISITRTVGTLILNSIVVVLIFVSLAKVYRRRKGVAPKGFQSLMEPLIVFIRDDVARASIGEKHYERFTPFLLTLFFFIFLNNLLGIIPFFPWSVGVTANIAVTGVMALIVFIITTVNGNKHYWTDIFNTPGVPWWLKFPIPLMPVVEVMGLFIKPIVLMIRLFANMIAGHTAIMGFVALIFIFAKFSVGLGYGVSVVSVLFSIFLDLLEVLVALIQAYVFTILSALYFGMAVETPKNH
ncbi:MAG: F0F1 ATP synthase subunit A [Bacteroidales bacterium]|nr:F0F1 ATP synthase subunit A [Bacteroidales bacterium]